MIIITSHASFVNGNVYEAPANTLVEILKENNDFIFIRHSIDGNLPSVIYEYKKGETKTIKLFVIQKFHILRYITEVFSTLSYFLLKKVDEPIYYIGVDPLNAFIGILLKKVGKFKVVIFFTVDYSRQRFKNKILNNIYHFIDRFCIRNADEVWNVSKRIWQIRSEMGLPMFKNILIPNVPSKDYNKYSNNKKQNSDIITLGIIDEQLDFIGIFDAIKDLKDMFPQILLKIVGNGPKEREYREYVKNISLDENVKFLGYLSHDLALKEISKSGIGLALYNGKWNFNHFGDSMKCREYFCFGLPVITTDTHSTVEDIKEYNAGIVCNLNKEEYKKAIIKILENYEVYSNNSYSLALKYVDIHYYHLNKLLK